MDSFNNSFCRLNFKIINADYELIMLGIDKIVVAFNKNEITNYSQFIEKLREIYEDYGIVEGIYNKEGFRIIEFNNLHINNIWNYINNDDIIQIALNYDKKDLNSNKNDKLEERYNFKKDIKNNITYSKNISSKHRSNNSLSNIKKGTNIFNNFNKNKKNLISSSSISESSESNAEYDEGDKNERSNKKNEEEASKKTNINEIKGTENYTNNKKNKKSINLLGKKRKAKNDITNKINDNNKINKLKKNSNPEENENIKQIQYELIQSDKLDNISFLKANYPKLFLQGTNIKFKIQELLKTGIGVGNYHFGVIDNYNPENNSFLIKNCNSLNEKTMLFMYQCDDGNMMSIELKNFVEIWIETKKGKNYLEKDSELTKHFIRRQVEYYFCDKNYEKDNFLKQNEDDKGFIPISVILGFNKIQMITKDKNEFIEALKENEKDNLGEDNNKSYELNEDYSKIRKIK